MKRLGGTFSRLFDELVRERIGLASSRRHEQAKERVLVEAMKRAGVTDEAAYLARIEGDQKEFDALISDLTVPETYFFRDPPHYEMLRREVLPAISAARGRDHVIEVWSAGCASGEEPYSLTMLLEQELLAHRSNVLGTDVSLRALARAARATYGRWSLRATNERDRERYFEPVGREFRLTERIRARVRFQQHSLMAVPYPRPKSFGASFDLILCRNVMIYFDPASIALAGQQLASSLAEDGWLMLGPSDPRLDVEEWCDTVATPCGMLYRRRSAHAPKRPSRRARQKTSPPSAPPSARPAPFEWTTRRSAHKTSSLPAAPAAPAAPTEQVDEAVALAQQVRGLMSEHGVAAAEVGCRELVNLHPLSAPAHLLHASLLVDLERDADAAEALRRALYLDRSLLVAQMLSATLSARRGRLSEAVRGYEQVIEQARVRPAEEPVLLGEGLTHGGLAELAEQRARALKSRGKA